MNKKNILILIALSLVLGFLVVKMFGTTVKDKYNFANSGVKSDVTFGGPSDRSSSHSRPWSRKRPSPAPMARLPINPQPTARVPAPAELTAAGYTDYGVNERTQTREDHLSTFAIDVDTASYTQARNYLKRDVIPPSDSIRLEEFVNYFRYDYPSPQDGAFSAHVASAKSPFSADSDTYLLRVGIQAKKVSGKDRKPVHLTFLVDTSGSMGASDKLPLAKDALKMLTRKLRGRDTVALATYAGSTREVLAPTGLTQQQRILDAIDSLGAGGGTEMESGMKTAYSLAMRSFKPGHVNRVIVVSDGDANIGAMSHEDILTQIRSYVDEGVSLSTIGVGMGSYNDTMMEQLANKGNGNYYYIDGPDEASKIFGEQVDGTLQIVAKDVKVQVDFDPELVKSYRLLGYENRDIADEDFRDDKVDAGEIGAGHTVTALYEVTLHEARGQLATVRIRAKKPDGLQAHELQFPWHASNIAPRLADSDGDLQFAAAVASFAEIMRGSVYARHLSLDWVEEVAASQLKSHPERREFVDLVRQAKRLRS